RVRRDAEEVHREMQSAKASMSGCRRASAKVSDEVLRLRPESVSKPEYESDALCGDEELPGSIKSSSVKLGWT
ncbi:MAG: hypothetical protein VYB14_03545, partial [Planctomycetota bacterium]|nr:hypothetical protein [Planctomycetota bacterium]